MAANSLAARLGATRRRVRRHAWLLALAALAVAVQASGLARVLPGAQPPPTGDSVVFEYYGWYLAEGARLYVDLWEVKPPLSFQTTALLALVAGGNQLLYHYLAVALTAAASVAGVVLAGALAADLTGDRRAALAVGLAAYASPVVFVRPAYGFKAKYLVVLAGLLAVWLLLRDRPFWGGVAAAAAVGYWQLGAVFPLVAVGLAAQRGGRRGLAHVVAGGLGMAALTLGPVVLRDGLVAMLAQTVLAPLLVGGSLPLYLRLAWLVELLAAGLPVVLLGLGGVAAVVAGDRLRRHWWLPATWCWFAGHVALVNLDYYADLVPLLFVNAVAVAALVDALPDRPWVRLGATLPGWPAGGAREPLHGRLDRPPIPPAAAVVALLAAVALVNVATLGAAVGTPYPVKQLRTVGDPADVAPPYVGDERRALLFGPVEAEACHVFATRRQRDWIALTGGSLQDRVCGRLPPGYGWLRAAVPAPLRGPAPS